MLNTKPFAGEAALKLKVLSLVLGLWLYTKPFAGEAALKPEGFDSPLGF